MKEFPPPAAFAFLEEERQALFLDVRTVEEFEAGHPTGSLNVPIAMRGPSGQMEENPEFQSVVESLAPDRTRPIVCSCHMGGRSRMACQMLEQAGYSALYNLDGGFGGRRTPWGAVAVPGWAECGLPTSTACGEGVSYESLRVRAGLDT